MTFEPGNRKIPLGVVIEKRRTGHPWQEFSWMPVAVIPGAPEIDEWRPLRATEDGEQFHAATLTLEIFPKETDGYKNNLTAEQAKVFVVLRPSEEDGEPEVTPFLVTVCPYEAQDYLDSGEEVVEGVPMPDEIYSWLKAFVDKHHVDEPFVKRQRKKYQERRVGAHRFRDT